MSLLVPNACACLCATTLDLLFFHAAIGRQNRLSMIPSASPMAQSCAASLWTWVRTNESTGGKPTVGRIHFVRSIPILQVVNGVQMLKFDLGAAPSDFSPSPPGRKLRGTQRPATFLKNGDFPQPVVAPRLTHTHLKARQRFHFK